MHKIDTICIVDDDPIHVFTTKRALRNSQICHQIITFDDGKSAYDGLLNIDTEALPDLILLDLNMPIWDGWNFLDEFKKLNLGKKIKIFITSSSQDPEDIMRAKYYEQVHSFIFKPFSIEKLKAELTD